MAPDRARGSRPHRGWRARTALRDDQGVALIMVLGLGMVMTLVLVALSGYALNGYVQSKTQVDHSTAIAAVEAGVDDYVSRLNDNELYWTKNDVDPTNPALTTWVGVPGSTNGGAYRYSVDSSTTLTDGVVRLTVSGKVGKEVRTVVVKLARMAFTDYVYFSDFETGDPANPAFYRGGYWGSGVGQHDPATTCGVYSWAAGWNTRDTNCTKIYWTQNDIVDGWFHTNDLFAVRDHPLFKGLLETGCPATRPGDPCFRNPLWVPDPGSSPRLEQPPAVGSRLSPMPASNSALKAEADPAQGGQGCLYTGPTRIVFNADGTMAVDSPSTPRSAPCGTGARVALPANGVVFVQNLPAGRSPKHNQAPYVSTPDGVSRPANSGGTSFPLPGDITPYSSRNGDAFVEGTLKGQVTVATDNDIVITGDLTYANAGGTDVLGLVAQNNVSLYHPVDGRGQEMLADGQMKDVQVWGALLSVQHSINVQNHAYGSPRGDFTVHGSIIQRWRGAVGTFNSGTGRTMTGYRKDWHWDPRLRYAKPPRYLDPVAASWHAIDQAETTAAFASGG